MTLFALSAAFLIGVTPPLPLQETVQLSFLILNDDQTKVITLNQGEFYFNPPTDFVIRENVRLKGWYQDENLTRFHDFDAPINQDTLFTTVGQPQSPLMAGNGGLIRGLPRFPSSDSINAVSSPQM